MKRILGLVISLCIFGCGATLPEYEVDSENKERVEEEKKKKEQRRKKAKRTERGI